MNGQHAIVLLSGGLDSATVAAIAKSEGYRITALSFRYGQRHEAELDAANRVGRAIGVERHILAEVDLRSVGGSALTADIAVPTGRSIDDMGSGIPVTYVPARNTLFLSYALAWAESLGIFDVFLGVNALDYSGYPDCRPEFIAAFETMANLALKMSVESNRRLKIHAPLISMTKSEIISTGLLLGVDYGLTSSCYAPDDAGASCGECDACRLRLNGFAEAGAVDSIRYASAPGVEV
jgi:7-cyano-7-deazaguanine synthase